MTSPATDPRTAASPDRIGPRTVVRGLFVVCVVFAHVVYAAVTLVIAAPGGRPRRSSAAQRRLSGLVMALGASYIKAAQLASTRRDVLPSGWCDTLARFTDRVPPMSPRVARRALRAAYPDGALTEADLDWDSVASGSIACVYRATLADGRSVAVKVRRPGVATRIRDDFALMRAGARLMQHLPAFRRLPAATVMAQLGDAVTQQADLDRERHTLDALRANLADVDYLRIPAPVPELCRPGVLVMEYIPGLRALPSDGTRYPDLAERVLTCAYRMLFLDGLVHCDMHPGNLYLRPGGEIVLVDAGFVVRLTTRVRMEFAEFFLAMAHGDGERCADVVRRSATQVPEDAELAEFRTGMLALIAESSRQQSGDFSLIRFATRLFDLQRRHGLFTAPEFVFPLLALLVLEGRIKELDSEIDFQFTAMPVLAKALHNDDMVG